MRRRGRDLLLVGLVALFAALPNITRATPDWVTVAPPRMGFRASFPRAPTHRSDSTGDGRGTWVNHSWRTADEASGRGFQVTVKDYSRYDTSRITASAVLEATCQGILRDAPVAVLPGVVPGRRCTGIIGAEDLEVRVFWFEPRLVVLVSTCRRGSCEGASRRRFFDSFRVLPLTRAI